MVSKLSKLAVHDPSTVFKKIQFGFRNDYFSNLHRPINQMTTRWDSITECY